MLRFLPVQKLFLALFLLLMVFFALVMMSALHIFSFLQTLVVSQQFCYNCATIIFLTFELVLHLKMALHGMHMPIIIAATVASLLKWTA